MKDEGISIIELKPPERGVDLGTDRGRELVDLLFHYQHSPFGWC